MKLCPLRGIGGQCLRHSSSRKVSTSVPKGGIAPTNTDAGHYRRRGRCQVVAAALAQGKSQTRTIVNPQRASYVHMVHSAAGLKAMHHADGCLAPALALLLHCKAGRASTTHLALTSAVGSGIVTCRYWVASVAARKQGAFLLVHQSQTARALMERCKALNKFFQAHGHAKGRMGSSHLCVALWRSAYVYTCGTYAARTQTYFHVTNNTILT